MGCPDSSETYNGEEALRHNAYTSEGGTLWNKQGWDGQD
jgi:hypothetical protein